MAHLGVFCLPMPSHMNLFLALARTLSARGHQLTFYGLPSNAERIRGAGFHFQALEPDSVPPGTLDRMMREMSSLGKLGSMRLQARFDELRYEAILRKGPGLVEQARLDALIVDQAEACSGSVAEVTGLPWVSVCSGLCLNSEPYVPPFFTSWSYSESWWAVRRNQLAYAGLKLAATETKRLINRYRKMWRLAPFDSFDQTFSPFAQVSQQVHEFDFVRRELPECFHYVGPISLPPRGQTDFPWERLDGRPLIYGSLGTLMNRNEHLYRVILDACANLDAQLVLSLGGAGNVHAFKDVPENAVLVDFAPQRELLRRATMAITHAGLNSTLEAFAEGLPLVAIPITFEQPGIAARIRWTGAGEFIPSSGITAERLRTAVLNVLREPSYRQSARKIAEAIAASGGVQQAASIIEEVMRTGRPVTASSPAAQGSRLYGD